jgi:hypothetical protein
LPELRGHIRISARSQNEFLRHARSMILWRPHRQPRPPTGTTPP